MPLGRYHRCREKVGCRNQRRCRSDGAGSAIAFCAAKDGAASLTICNLDAGRTAALAARVSAAYPDCAVVAGDPDPAGHDVVINATPCGLRPDDPLPVDARLAEEPRRVV